MDPSEIELLPHGLENYLDETGSEVAMSMWRASCQRSVPREDFEFRDIAIEGDRGEI
jgi:hypothetical protein